MRSKNETQQIPPNKITEKKHNKKNNKKTTKNKEIFWSDEWFDPQSLASEKQCAEINQLIAARKEALKRDKSRFHQFSKAYYYGRAYSKNNEASKGHRYIFVLGHKENRVPLILTAIVEEHDYKKYVGTARSLTAHALEIQLTHFIQKHQQKFDSYGISDLICGPKNIPVHSPTLTETLKNEPLDEKENTRSSQPHFEKPIKMGKQLIHLSLDQANAVYLSLPALVLGVAGAGKTLIALQKIFASIETIRENVFVTNDTAIPRSLLLYVAPPSMRHLVHQVQTLYEQQKHIRPDETHEKSAPIEVKFLTYDEWACAWNPVWKTYTPVGILSFQSWLSNVSTIFLPPNIESHPKKSKPSIKSKHAKKSKQSKAATSNNVAQVISTEDIYYELQIRASYVDASLYLTTGLRGSRFTDPTLKEEIVRLYPLYLSYLASHQNVDFTICAPALDKAADLDVTELLAFDEGQDIPLCGIMAAAREPALVSKLAIYGDINQSIHANAGIAFADILQKNFAYLAANQSEIDQKLRETQQIPLQATYTFHTANLDTSYRTSTKAVLALARLFLNFGVHINQGKISNFQGASYNPASEDIPDGSLSFTNTRENLATTVDTVVIVSDLKTKLFLEALYPNCFILMVNEVKGLEFATVILYNLLQDPSLQKVEDLLKKLNAADEENHPHTHDTHERFKPSRALLETLKKPVTSSFRSAEKSLPLENQDVLASIQGIYTSVTRAQNNIQIMEIIEESIEPNVQSLNTYHPRLHAILKALCKEHMAKMAYKKATHENNLYEEEKQEVEVMSDDSSLTARLLQQTAQHKKQLQNVEKNLVFLLEEGRFRDAVRCVQSNASLLNCAVNSPAINFMNLINTYGEKTNEPKVKLNGLLHILRQKNSDVPEVTTDQRADNSQYQSPSTLFITVAKIALKNADALPALQYLIEQRAYFQLKIPEIKIPVIQSTRHKKSNNSIPAIDFIENIILNHKNKNSDASKTLSQYLTDLKKERNEAQEALETSKPLLTESPSNLLPVSSKTKVPRVKPEILTQLITLISQNNLAEIKRIVEKFSIQQIAALSPLILFHAIQHYDLPVFKYLFNAYLSQKIPLDQRDEGGLTILHFALEVTGIDNNPVRAEIIQMILYGFHEQKIPLDIPVTKATGNALDLSGFIALHQLHDLRIARLIIDAYVKDGLVLNNKSNSLSLTPIHMLAERPDTAPALNYLANIYYDKKLPLDDESSVTNETPLAIACNYNNVRGAAILLTYLNKTQPNELPKEFLIAVKKNQGEIVKLMLDPFTEKAFTSQRSYSRPQEFASMLKTVYDQCASALRTAVRNDHLETVLSILGFITTQDDDVWIKKLVYESLKIAAAKNYANMIKGILTMLTPSRKESVLNTPHHIPSPFLIAVLKNHLSAAAFLLKAGSNLDKSLNKAMLNALDQVDQKSLEIYFEPYTLEPITLRQIIERDDKFKEARILLQGPKPTASSLPGSFFSSTVPQKLTDVKIADEKIQSPQKDADASTDNESYEMHQVHKA